MGKLYELIRKDIEELKKYREFEKEDFNKAKTFTALYDVESHRHKVNALLDAVSVIIRKNKSDKEFENIVDKYEGVRKDISIIPVNYSYEYKMNPILDYEELLNHIEKNISDEVVDEIKAYYDTNKDYIKPVKKTLEPYVKAILIDMKDIKMMSDTEKEIATKYLNYAKDMLVEKQNNSIDRLIDMVSQKRTTIADGRLEEWANKNGMDGYKAGVYDGKHEHVIGIGNDTAEERELFKPVLDTKLNYSDEFKNKMLELNRFLKDKAVLADAQAGESGFKEYGFITYFNTAAKINSLVDNQLKLDNEKDKVENLYKISAEVNKLQKIEREYDEILAYIKENFNLDDVSLCGNIYSGRQTQFGGNLSRFKSTLPEKWDNENAPYGVILNGYVQLMSLVEKTGSTLEDMINDPIGEYISGAKNNLDKITDSFSIKASDATLGKRIANTLFLQKRLLTPTYEYLTALRGIEFLYNQCEENEKTYDDITSLSIAITYAKRFVIQSDDLFGSGVDIDLDSLKNLFAFGNDFDNLFSLSKNYPTDLDRKGLIASSYDAQIKSKASLNPIMECRKVLETCKDFFNEYKRLITKSANNDCCINPGAIVHAGREYFKDYLLKNNINPLDIKDDKERKEVLDFLKDPVDALYTKYRNNNDFFTPRGSRGLTNFSDLEYSYKECFLNKYERNVEYFTNRMAVNVVNTTNNEKNINQMLEDNKGGYLERKFGTTSKEYNALTEAVKATMDAYSTSYGDFTMPKYFAQKYLDHKLPEGANENNLKPNEKRRVEFCRSIIKTCDELDRRNKELDDAKKIEDERARKASVADSYKEREDKYKEIMEKHKKDKEYSYSNDVKLVEKVKEENNVDIKPNFAEQVKKDLDESIISDNFDIPSESEMGKLELNK